MADQDPEEEGIESTEEPSSERSLSRGKKILIGTGVAVVLGGIAISMTSGGGGGGAAPGGANMLVPGASSSEAVSEDVWGPLLVKGGSSLLIGFAVGYMARFFVKMLLLVGGLIALALFGLNYAGVIDVDWEFIRGHIDAILPQVKEGTGKFQAFITSNLPSAGAGGFGLVAGFKR